jgi:hypothetical protein
MTIDVDTISVVDDAFGNDTSVDTKCLAGDTFGNDAGFIRVRKRKLKGGHPDLRTWRLREGRAAIASTSFDLVRAVRVNGKPRHKFVLGLGSLKSYERGSIVWFWVRVVWRLTKHGFDADQRRRLAAEMVRKGARLPMADECRAYSEGWQGRYEAEVDEIASWIKAAGATADKGPSR